MKWQIFNHFQFFSYDRRFLTILATLITCSSGAKQVPCEQVYSRGWSVGDLKTCFMQNTTTIDARDFKISTTRDEAVEAITYEENKKISYLPLEAYKKFPNLQAYAAWGCSIKIVKRDNFKNLYRMKLINLSQNQIEMLFSDTFEGLLLLEEIYLCEI